MSDKKASVLIVDDHPLFRERLCQLINNEPDLQVCGEAETAENAVHLVHAARPDLAIVDITLKGSSGLEFTKTLRTCLRMHGVWWWDDSLSERSDGGAVGAD